MPSQLETKISEVQQHLQDAMTSLSQLSAALPKEVETDNLQPTSMVGVQNLPAFYDYIRGDAGELFPTFNQTQLSGVAALLSAGAGVLPLSWMAYVLATAYHETNRTMQPVKEAYWLSEDWRKQHLKYYPYYGRGLVQLTWDYNYKKAGELLGIDLVDQPDLALQLQYAVKIIISGMLNGWFTGKTLRDYLPAAPSRDNYKNARQIVNGTDKADLIAGYAIEFEKGLKLGDWR